jgi:hypothetical protein
MELSRPGNTPKAPGIPVKATTGIASRRGEAGSRHDGKQVGAPQRAPARGALGLVPSLIETAGYGMSCEALAKEGPVYSVGWDPWLAL